MDILELIGMVLITLSTCVVLPVLIVWITNRRKAQDLEKKSEILMALLEKKPELDPSEVIKKLDMSQKKRKSIKQELLEKLMSGCMITLVGVVLLVTHLLNFIFMGSKTNGIIFGGVVIAVGVAMLIYFFASKKLLKKEIDAEEKQLNEQL